MVGSIYGICFSLLIRSIIIFVISTIDRARLLSGTEVVYFVHSYCATPNDANREYIASLTNYGTDYEFISSIQHKNIVATQFHPEKSGETGVNILRLFLEGEDVKADDVVVRKICCADLSFFLLTIATSA